MRDANLEEPFLDSQEDNADVSEPVSPARKDLTYHGDVRRLLEIRREILQLQQELANFDEKDQLSADLLSLDDS